MTNLQPALAGDQSLSTILRQQAQEFSGVTGIPVDVRPAAGFGPLPPDCIAALYRVTQEALANVYKHAGATQITLHVACTNGRLRLEVRDNGCGFSPPGVGDGHGLANMQHRVAQLGGELIVDSAPGRGTLVAATVPLAR